MTKEAMSLRACAVQFCMAMLAMSLSGCFSISITHEFDGIEEEGELGGKYNIKNIDARLASALWEYAPKSIVFTAEDSPAALPLEVRVSNVLDEKDSTSAIGFLPGLLTLCTFPVLMERQRIHVVKRISPIGVKEIGIKVIGRKSGSWTPLGLLPFAFALDGYDGAIDKLKNDAIEAAWAEGLTNAVAQAVILTLTKTRYDAYMKKLSDKESQKKIANAANQREIVLRMAERGWPQEAMLRDFAVKETTGLWDIVVSFRAEISIRKNRLQRLSDAIKGFGRKPEEDSDYIKCKGEYDTARGALVQIFKNLESAYLAASKNDALYDSAEARARTSKAVDECSSFAVDAANRILKNK